jgi:hypothetical protein
MNAAALAQAFLPPVVRQALAGVLFAWLVVALGRRVSKLLSLPLAAVSPWEKALLCGALGAGLAQYIPYVLAQFGMFRPSALRASVALLAVLLCVDLFAVARVLRRLIAERSLSISRELLPWAAIGAGLLLLLLLRSSTVGPLSDDDGYHLASPKRWLALGTLAYLPTYTNTNAAMGFEMLYAVGLSVWDVVAAKAFNYASGLFTLLGVWLCAYRLSGRFAGVIAVTLALLTTPVSNISSVMSLAYVDLGACWMVMACLLTFLLWREHQDQRLLVCMALFAGLAASFKTTALMTGVAWAPIVLFERKRLCGDWPRALTSTVAFGVISVLPTLPWFWRNYRNTGNPLYPMLSSVLPTRDWTAAQASILGKYVHYYTWGISAGERLSEGTRKGLLFGAILGIALFGGFLASRVRRPELRNILIFATLFTAISTQLTGLITRYWLASMLCSCVVIGVLAAESKLSPRWRVWAVTALMAVSLGYQIRHDPYGHKLKSDLRLAAGLSSLEEELRDDPGFRVWNHLNAHTPSEAHVLMAAFYRAFGASSYGGFWVDRTCYATDPHLQGYLRLDDWQAFLRSLHVAAIDYIVLTDDQPAISRLGFHFAAADNEYPFCKRLVEEYGEKVYQFDHLAVYHLTRALP